MTDDQSDKLRAFLQKRKAEREQSQKEAPVKKAEAKPVVPDVEKLIHSQMHASESHHQNEAETQDVPLEAEVSPQEEVSSMEHSEEGSDKQPENAEDALAQFRESLVGSKRAMSDEQMAEIAEKESAEKKAKLKAYLARRKEIINEEVDMDDPYGGDYIAKKNLRYLQKYLDRNDIEDIKEIVINRPLEVGLEFSDGHWEWIEDPDLTAAQLEDIARSLANKSGQLFHSGNPILSVKMPGGHRVQIVAGFNAPSGFIFSMRMQRKEKFGLDDFQMPDDQREKIKELVRTQKTLLISGGTGTGKTSFMNALIPSIPEDERLVTLEDVAELRLPHRNWAQLLFSGSSSAKGDQGVIALLNACLRLRPDRIILGEIRKENAFAFCSAINTGHEGSMATIHANSPRMAVDAVINRVLMNGDLPESALTVLRRQLAADIYAVVQLHRIHKGVKAELVILEEDATLLE